MGSADEWGDLGLHFDGVNLIAGRVFTSFKDGTFPRTGLAAFNPADGSNTGEPIAWSPELGGNGAQVHAFTSSGVGLLVGGRFDLVEGEERISLVGFSSSIPVTLSSFTVE